MHDYAGGWYAAAAPGLAKVLRLPRLTGEGGDEAMQAVAGALRSERRGKGDVGGNLALPKLRNAPKWRSSLPEVQPGHHEEVLQRRYEMEASREEKLQMNMYMKMEKMRYIAGQKQHSGGRGQDDDTDHPYNPYGGSNSKFLMEKRAGEWSRYAILALFTGQLIQKHAVRRAYGDLRRLYLPIARVFIALQKRVAHRANVLKNVQDANKLKPPDAFLFSHYMIKPLNPAMRGLLLPQIESRAFAKGEHILFEGEQAKHFCVIAHGSASLETCTYETVVYDANGKPITRQEVQSMAGLGRHKAKKERHVRQLSTLAVGESFGEFCMLPNLQQVCALIAQEETVVYYVSRDAIMPLHEQLAEDVQAQVHQTTVTMYKELLRTHFQIQPRELAKLEVFSVFQEEELLPLVETVELEIHPEGHVLYDVGDVCTGCFYLARGSVVVYNQHGQIIRRAGRGSLLGDGDVISVTQRACKVVIDQPADIWAFPKDAVNSVILRNPAYLLDFRDRINREDERSMTMDQEHLLATVKGLSALPLKHQKLIFAHGRPRVFSIGECVAQRGQYVKDIILLVRGSLHVSGDEADYRVNASTLLGYTEATNPGQWKLNHKAAEKCFTWLVAAKHFVHRDDDKGRLQAVRSVVKSTKATPGKRKEEKHETADPSVDSALKAILDDDNEVDRLYDTDKQIPMKEVQRIVKKSMKLVSFGKHVWVRGAIVDPTARQYDLTDYETQVLELHYRQKLLSMWQPTDEELVDETTIPDAVLTLTGTLRGAANLRGLLEHVRQRKVRQGCGKDEPASPGRDVRPLTITPLPASPLGPAIKDSTASDADARGTLKPKKRVSLDATALMAGNANRRASLTVSHCSSTSRASASASASPPQDDTQEPASARSPREQQ